MSRKTKAVLFSFFFFVAFIEGGMRLTIWWSANELTHNAEKYKIEVIVYDIVEYSYVCPAHSEESYLSVSYTLWLVKDVFWVNMMCQIRGPHIDISVWTKESSREHDKRDFINYYWSFKQWSFIDSEREQQMKFIVKKFNEEMIKEYKKKTSEK
ncbi:hypothetical protein [Leminorella grimontii]|uniref:hypothetical protein n=1 Tax=Leminorella grimontii TaxID=82981 RepID=UPI0021C375CD|nr:hypothetical protein [Leminorella grimontii]